MNKSKLFTCTKNRQAIRRQSHKDMYTNPTKTMKHRENMNFGLVKAHQRLTKPLLSLVPWLGLLSLELITLSLVKDVFYVFKQIHYRV